MSDKIIDVKLKISDTLRRCPLGHLTRYAVVIPEQGEVCSFCLACGTCDKWFD